MKTGTQLIEEERERQISKEGWTPEHANRAVACIRFVRPLSGRQKLRLSRVVAECLTEGACLYRSCQRHGIRYETAKRGLGLPTGGATITTASLLEALRAWPNSKISGEA